MPGWFVLLKKEEKEETQAVNLEDKAHLGISIEGILN